MDNFIVSARKYRPDSFESVVGQDSITHTLKNSIRTRQLAQAYLFCGPRGVGKTTCARIFAKTINCFNITENHEACNVCESCKTFNESRSLNIHELDAASNNSVDDIRNLIDQVRIPPQIGKYSVYIIDEVHMLTSSAFNAFLKTLEEPPKHVVFILATTEKHKIIPTILSRCQIFDFNRISIHDITGRLQYVANSEGIVAEADALSIIAQKADGAMRDALSIFDQIVSFTGNRITYQSTIENLNVLDYEYYFKITGALLKNDYNNALITLNEIIEEGFDSGVFLSGLGGHFRDILMCKDPGTVKLLEVGENIQKRYHEYAGVCDVDFLFKAIEISNEADYKYKTTRNKRLLAELCLLKISQIKRTGTNIVPDDKRTAAEPAKVYISNQAKPEIHKTIQNQNSGSGTEATLPISAEIKNEISEPDIKNNIQVSDSGTANGATYVNSFSIKNIGKSNSNAQQNVTDKNDVEPLNVVEIGEDEFDDKKLQRIWSEFADKLTEKPRLFQLFQNTKPLLTQENTILLELANKGLISLVETIKIELISFLKTSLNNRNIHVELKEVVITESGEKLLYTDDEKLSYMIEKKPELGNLIQQLDLNL